MCTSCGSPPASINFSQDTTSCALIRSYFPTFFTANLRGGFVHKTDEISAVLRENDVDVACITETWLKQSVPSEVVNIPGYAMHRRDRKDGQRGGGVAVFVRHNVPCVRLPSLESANFEVVWLQPQTTTYASRRITRRRRRCVPPAVC